MTPAASTSADKPASDTPSGQTPSGYTRTEEFASALIHGLAALAAAFALVLLLEKAAPVLSSWQFAGVAVYGSSLIALFFVSTLYHALVNPAAKDILKRIDHGAIFVVIAGTYTPFMTITLQSSAARVLLVVIWSLAVAGIVFKIFFVHRFRWLSLATYLSMGWASIVVVWDLWQSLPRPGFMLLVAGGLCFTVGAVFYSLKSIRYTHAIWHVWVVAGVACHAASIGYYVIPQAARPAPPAWHTDAASCSWHWREGGGIGVWAERCELGTGLWQVVWDDSREAFVQRRDAEVLGIVIQSWTLPVEQEISSLTPRLISGGHLDAGAECEWQSASVRPAPRTVAFFVLAPTAPDALAPTAEGEVPAPQCGPYGKSTHGVRYFISDLRHPDRVIFVEEGQERPMFDPASISVLQ